MEQISYGTNPENTQKKQSSWGEVLRFVLFVLIAVIPLRMLVAQPFIVSGSSMDPTFENGDYLIIDELSYRLSEPERLDVVVFRYPGDQTKFFIKRIIGLPGDTVIINGNEVTIINEKHPEGLKIDQPYVQNPSSNSMTFKLKEDEFFVMGDNRVASSDSRYWGPVHRKLLIGKPFLRLLPTSKIDITPGDYKQEE